MIAIVQAIKYSPLDGGLFHLTTEDEYGRKDYPYIDGEQRAQVRAGSHINYRTSGNVVDLLKVLAY